MKNNRFKDNLWRFIFPALSVILWIVTIILFFASKRSYSSDDFEAPLRIASAIRWQPACFIGAVISTAAAYVIDELYERGSEE